MIKLTRLNHNLLILNSDLIELIEVTPDTVIKLTTGQKLMVLESAEEVVEKITNYRKSLFSNCVCCRCASHLADQKAEGTEQEPTLHGR